MKIFMQAFAPLFISWLLSSCWLFLLYLPVHDMTADTQKTMLEMKPSVQAYIKTYHTPPQSLAELRVFSLEHHSAFSAYDSFSQRLQFQGFSDNSWLLRSFGADGDRDTLLTHDDVIVSAFPAGLTGIHLQKQKENKQLFYPAISLLGTFSSDHRLLAKVYEQHQQLTKHLLVHALNDSKILTSQYEHVDEFFWLADNKHIVFTSDHSEKFFGGLILWNLETNEEINLFSHSLAVPSQTSDKEEESAPFISLAYYDQAQNDVYFFVKNKERQALALDDFISDKNLYVLHASSKIIAKVTPDYLQKNLGSVHFPFKGNFNHTRGLLCDQVAGLQKEWCELPLTGNLETLIAKWQAYTEKVIETPLFPYCLLILSSFYSDAYVDQKKQESRSEDKRAEELLRSYGTELALTLSHNNTAPLWLKSVGWWMWESFSQGQPLPYKILQP